MGYGDSWTRSKVLSQALRILMMIGCEKYSVRDIMETQGISRKTVYRYLDSFRAAGIGINYSNHIFSLSKNDSVEGDLSKLFLFSPDEAVTLYNAIDVIETNSVIRQRLKDKLTALYGAHVVQEKLIRRESLHSVKDLMLAIANEQQVILHGYSSPNSATKRDRLVEPFRMGPDNEQVWCYDVDSGKCKTFKVSRIQKVEVTEKSWHFKHMHVGGYTDPFRMISNDGRMFQCRLLLNRRAMELLREEYPLSEQYISQTDTDIWQADIPVSNYVGIGRFVAGLMDHIQIQTPELQQYIREYLKRSLDGM